MKIYFDTNIYSYIRDRSETDAVSQLLASQGVTLVGSSENLFEIYAIPNEQTRLKEISVFTQLVEHFHPHPISWLHASELRVAIKQLRPAWLRQNRGKNNIPRLLNLHYQRYLDAKLGILPQAEGYADYRRDSELGAAALGHFQKDLRKHAVAKDEVIALVDNKGKIEPVDMLNAERAWRMDGMSCWFNAIVIKHPASRDYADWLAPYLRPDSFRHESYEDFWLKDLSAEAVPLNRITGLTSFYQLRGKITHGNGQDQLHSNHWWLSDLFLTADRQFHDSLSYLAQNHFPDKRPPTLVIRGEDSFLKQLQAILHPFPLNSELPSNVRTSFQKHR